MDDSEPVGIPELPQWELRRTVLRVIDLGLRHIAELVAIGRILNSVVGSFGYIHHDRQLFFLDPDRDRATREARFRVPLPENGARDVQHGARRRLHGAQVGGEVLVRAGAWQRGSPCRAPKTVARVGRPSVAVSLLRAPAPLLVHQ